MKDVILPYYPIVTERKASELLGISLKQVRKLVSDDQLEVTLKGDNVLVNNYSLKRYIDTHGDAKNRLKAKVMSEVIKRQDKIIENSILITTCCIENQKSLIEKYYKSGKQELVCFAQKLKANLDYPIFKYFTNDELCNYYLIYSLQKRNEKVKLSLLKQNINESEINQLIDSFNEYLNSFDFENDTFSWKIKTPTVTIKKVDNYREFFETHKVNSEKFKRIKFLPYSEVKKIILQVKKRRVL